MLGDPDERAYWQEVKKEYQLAHGNVNAAMRKWTAQGRLIAKTVNVDIAAKRIHISAPVSTRLQSFQPENAVDDRSIRQSLPGQANGLAASKDGAKRVAASNFLGDAMETERGLTGIGDLARTEPGCRNEKPLLQAETE